VLEIKSREDFGIDIVKSDRVFVVYGANNYGQRFLNLNIPYKIDFFCDPDAENTAFMESAEGKIKVLSIDDLKTIKDALDVLICIPPAKEYEYTYEQLKPIYGLLDSLEVDVRVYTIFDNKSCITKIGDKIYLLDKDMFLAHNPEHFRYIYNDINYYSDEYIKELSRQPASMCVIDHEKVELSEYRSKYVNHFWGKRKTFYKNTEYQNKIYVLGDSRTSGFMLEDKFTYCSLLQNILDENNLSYCIDNLGIPGREIERMVFQITNLNLKKGDIVFLIAGCYEYTDNIVLNQEVYLRFLIEAKQHCDKNDCEFVYINLPVIHEIKQQSEIEKNLIAISTTIRFKEYSYEIIEQAKRFLLYGCMQNGITSYDFAVPFQRPHSYGEVFIDLHHYGPRGNKLIADELYRIILTINEATKNLRLLASEKKKQKEIEFKEKLEYALQNDGCKQYLDNIIKEYNPDGYSNVGAIIMNCNPFTKGHRYLIEQAANQVERLYIFVLQEDKSEFTFEERFNLVVGNTKDLNNVVVIPSGDYIISSITFPEYFNKNNMQNNTINATRDLLIFATRIATKLHITKRFVGCEPFCNITKQYNMQMKGILPEYGIEVIEMDRYEVDNDAISASKVRKLIKEHNKEKLRKYVTDITYDYLIQSKFSDESLGGQLLKSIYIKSRKILGK
jgi:cytidyltransferase-like protein